MARSMDKRYCRIAPNINGSLASSVASVDDAKPQKRKRTPVRVACNACRTRKTACDGVRGCCQPCKKKGTECIYITDNIDDTPARALRRQHEKVQVEANDMTMILKFLRTSTDHEAIEALRRIRQSEDHSTVCDWIKNGTDGDFETIQDTKEETPSLSEADDLSSLDQSPSTGGNADTKNIWLSMYGHQEWDTMEGARLSISLSTPEKDGFDEIGLIGGDSIMRSSCIDPQILFSDQDFKHCSQRRAVGRRITNHIGVS